MSRRITLVDKVDILFDIDNSLSMGDKQAYLGAAVPDLVNRLVNPNCIDANGGVIGSSVAGVCTAGQLEFPPVHDMHLGIVTSSLGSRLSEPGVNGGACDPTFTAPDPYQNLSAHNDDRAHLIARSLALTSTSGAEGPVASAIVASYTPAPGGFLWWYPGTNPEASPVAPETTPALLISDFTVMVGGAGVFGCGIESQLESWYRFLVQPDPYDALVLDRAGKAQWSGVDTVILKERRDFLRPDSMVAVVVLTDENDSEIDVRSLGGQGYLFMQQGFNPSHGTNACASNPADPACVSCSVDPSCTNGTYSSVYDWGKNLNLRHVHMRAKYGVDAQYPIERYVNGLTSSTVPDRLGEYTDANGTPTLNYLGRNDCTNPLFAGSLPDGSDLSAKALCNLAPGPRTPDLVFFAIIGGVPNQLLHFKPGDPQASALSAADWVRILGADPQKYDYSGIDPHMIEDYRDRTTVAYPFRTDSSLTNSLSPSSSAPATPDPVSGREWVTDQPASPNAHKLPVDRQYACIFPLVNPRDCSALPDGAQNNGGACDCPLGLGAGLSPAETPPTCNPNNPTQQIAAKAYPTIRELLLAKLMGTQGIVASICPIHVSDQMAGNDPLYGYRPAVASIGDRMRHGLGFPCLPSPLPAAPGGGVQCSAYVTLPLNAGGTCRTPVCDGSLGLSLPDSTVLDLLCSSSAAGQSICELRQLNPVANPVDFDPSGSCAGSMDPGWCYVEGSGSAGCAQSIAFAAGSRAPGSTVNVICN